MPATDPPSSPDTPGPNPIPTAALDAGATPVRRPGRPGVERAAVTDAIDTFLARTGRHPSLRELRTALGNTGSLGTLAPILRAHRATRLLAGDAPAPRSPEAAIAKAMNAALALLGEEAAAAAEALAQDAHARDARRRVDAAEALRVRADNAAAESALERERAIGRVAALEETLADLRAGRDADARTLETARGHERELLDAVAALEAAARERERALAEHQDLLATEREARNAADKAAERERVRLSSELEAARSESGALRRAHAEELDALAARCEEDERAAREAAARMRALGERHAALERAHRELARDTARLGTERDAARERAERLDGALAALHERMQRLDGELEAARRTAADLSGHAGRLQGQLAAAGVAPADIEPTPPRHTAERQERLALGDETPSDAGRPPP